MAGERGRTHSNGFKLDNGFNKDTGKKWLRDGVVDEWSRLDSHVGDAETIDTFRKTLGSFVDGEVRWG